MTKPTKPPRDLAKKFHETYERLAPQYNYETRKASAVPFDSIPENNQELMIAVCSELDLIPMSDYSALLQKYEKLFNTVRDAVSLTIRPPDINGHHSWEIVGQNNYQQILKLNKELGEQGE